MAHFRSASWRTCLPLCLVALLAASPAVFGQTNNPVTINITGQKKTRLAVADFKNLSSDAKAAPLLATFNSVLWNDLNQSGVAILVSKSDYPLSLPGQPTDLAQPALLVWAKPPANAQDIAFGNLNLTGTTLTVEGYLYTTTQPNSPFLLGKRYLDVATPASARTIAHEFADAIIQFLGGVPGIAETKIVYIHSALGHSGVKEVWMMDYDGADKQPITHLHSICYSPRLSPGGHRIAFMTYASGSPQIRIYSLLAHRYLPFPRFPGLNETPAWSPDGTKLAFSSSMGRGGSTEIYVINANGTGLRQLTFVRGANLAPVWNPKTGAQIAFESDRTGLPQIYIMDADGSNQQRITTGGYAVSPSWSPNGLALAFSWVRRTGGENGGNADIYIYDLTSQKWEQLTHNGARNDFPSWAADGRHLVFQTGTPHRTQLVSVLADGSQPTVLTSSGSNSMPNWSLH